METKSNIFRKKATFAPESSYKNIDQVVQGGRGSGVEVVIAWHERVLQTAQITESKTHSVGTDPHCDIILPNLPGIPHQVSFLKLSPQPMVITNPSLHMKIVSDGNVQDINSDLMSSLVPLRQGELLKMQFENGISVLVRFRPDSPNPKIVPLLDFSSKGFWSVFLTTAFSGLMSLLLSWMGGRSKSVPTDTDIYNARLLINPPRPRLARIVVQPSEVEKPPKVRPKPLGKKPVVNIAKDGKQKPQNSRPKKGGRRNPKTPQKVVEQKIGARGALSSSVKAVTSSPLFSALGSGRNRDNRNSGTLDASNIGLAAKATNSAGIGRGVHDRGDGYSLRNVEGGGSRRNNVGVGALSGPSIGRYKTGGPIGLWGGKVQVAVRPGARSIIVEGQIDKEAIRKVFFNNSKAIRYCYETQLNRNPNLRGKILLDFEIGEQGRVVGRPSINRGGTTLANASMARCLLGRLKSWKFPEPPRNQAVRILYPLAFTNAK